MSPLIPGHNHDFISLGTTQQETIFVCPFDAFHEPHAAIGRHPSCSWFPIVNLVLSDWAALVHGCIPQQVGTAAKRFRFDLQRGWYICNTICRGKNMILNAICCQWARARRKSAIYGLWSAYLHKIALKIMLLIVTNLHKKCIPESQDGQNFWQRAICNLHSCYSIPLVLQEKSTPVL